MMDFLYGIHGAVAADDSAPEMGRNIYRYIQGRPAGQGVRFRREHLAELIDEMAAAKESASVLAIASGHLRESELSTAVVSGKLERFVALDADARSLSEVERLLETWSGADACFRAALTGAEGEDRTV